MHSMPSWRTIPSLYDPRSDTLLGYTVVEEGGLFRYEYRELPAELALREDGSYRGEVSLEGSASD